MLACGLFACELNLGDSACGFEAPLALTVGVTCPAPRRTGALGDECNPDLRDPCSEGECIDTNTPLAGTCDSCDRWVCELHSK